MNKHGRKSNTIKPKQRKGKKEAKEWHQDHCKDTFTKGVQCASSPNICVLILQTARVQEQEDRKQWGKRQRVLHTYGPEDDDDSSDDGPQQPTTSSQPGANDVINDNGADIVLTMGSKKQCNACGSTTHQRRSSKQCPFNKKNLPEIVD